MLKVMLAMQFWEGRVLAGLLPLLLAQVSYGQSFNLDLDIGVGSEAVGNGVPSSSFGAAASQPGFWNRLDAAAHTLSIGLFDLAGGTTSATIRWNMSGGGRGAGMGNNTGDYRLLLNDRTLITVPTTYHFENLLPGRYLVTTYAVDGGGNAFPVQVTVPGAEIPDKVSGNGTMPGDRFSEGVTHSFHSITISGTSFSVTAESLSERPDYGSVNGFQLTHVAVPEVGTIFGFLLGVAVLSRRRR